MGGRAEGLQREEARRWLLVLLPCLIQLLSVALAYAVDRGDVVGLRGREWLFAVLRKWVSLPCPRALRLPRQRVVAGTGGGDVLQQPGEVRCWLRGPSAAVLHAAAAGDVGREGGRGERGVAEGDEVAFRCAGVMASRTLPPGPTFTGPVRLQWLFETNAVLMTRGVFRSGTRRGRQKIPERHTSCPNACSMCMRADDVWKLWASRHLLPPPPPGHGTASSSPSP